MKKSRIIIPALAVMALSMGAAVTSTVAWFTANRNASATSSPISVINPEGDLVVEAAAGKGTKNASAGFVAAATIEHEKDFRDASVNLVRPEGIQVWTSNLDSNGDALVSGEQFREITDVNYKDGNAYCAQTYTLTFKFNKETMPKGDYGVFLDGTQYTDVGTGSGIVSTEADATSGSDKHVARALRIGLVSTKTLVYGPSRYTTFGTVNSHVNTNNTTADYAESVRAAKARTSTYAVKNQGQNFLGNIVVDEQGANTPLTVTVWTWFEGTDETNINSQSGTESKLTGENPIDVALKFNVVKCTAK